MEKADSAKPEFKKRSQFRVKHKNLNSLYQITGDEILTYYPEPVRCEFDASAFSHKIQTA
jgi:hypothetical protein